MTIVAIRKPGRPHGAKSQKTLLKAQADHAYNLLVGITHDRNASTIDKINAAAVIMEHLRSSQSL